MSFWNRFKFALLPHTNDWSDCERAEAVDLLWGNFINEYLKEYADIHVENDQSVLPQTVESKMKLQSRLKRRWFKPRALKGHKFMRGIDDSADYYPGGGFTWDQIKPGAQMTLDLLFDDMFHKVDRLIHEQSVYFYHNSRDCDQSESDGVERFDTWYEAAQWITGFYDNLEGPGAVSQISLGSYLIFEPTTRDYRAEQYNY